MDVLLRGIDVSTGSIHTLGIAAQWLAKCKASHAMCSTVAHGDTKRLPTRVIDVGSSAQQPKLIETGAAIGRWAALSYCWGGNSSFILISSSESRFKEGTALEDFPATLRDAIVVTRALGIPYLWIDALCIFQDSFDDWRREAPRMKEVYSGADVVIAATCAAEVNAGIFRTRPVEGSIELQWGFEARSDDAPVLQAGDEPKQVEVQNQTICLRRNHVPGLKETMGIYCSRWASRGWTMQEDFMATRLLVFQDETVTWQCLSKAEKEDGTDEPLADVTEDDANSRDSRDFMSQYWKRILAASSMSKEEAEDLNLTIPSGFFNNPYSMWYTTVEEYSDRRMTNITDRLPALSGLAALFQQVTGDEYCAGLWKSGLLRGLLWYYRPTRSERSTTIEMFGMDFEELASKFDTVYYNDHLQLTGNGPSWSWVSLEGWLQGGGQDSCHQFEGDVVVPATRIVDVQVDLVAADDPFGRVRGGRLTIKATYLSWNDPPSREEGQSAAANMRKFVAELLAQPGTGLNAEYQLRHQHHEGQVTAVLLIDCNTIQGRALLVESVQDSVASGDDDSARLYRRVGRFSIRKRQSYENETPGDFNHVNSLQNAAYEDCAKGLPMKTFIIV